MIFGSSDDPLVVLDRSSFGSCWLDGAPAARFVTRLKELIASGFWPA
jgi:pyruvate/2-oxoglutarate dehydrogenase complex dihydrolipoamide acyltransferase (E2) component